MKFTAKRLLAWVLAAALVGGFLPVDGLTPSAKAAEKISGSQIEVNPLYEGVLTEQSLLDRLEEQTPDDGSSDNRMGERSTVRNATYQTADELVDDVRDAMVQRKTEFTVYLKCSTSEDRDENIKKIFHDALEETSAANEGDYLRWQYGGYSCSYDGEIVGNEYRLALKYSLNYYTTAAQEKQVTKKVDEVLDSMNFTDSTKANEKIRDIYDYICAHVTYDYPHLNDNSYVLQYTAYGALIDGTAVCQGYATLLYRMLRESGVSSRVITSTDHAWNIAQIGALYYNLDSTWDAGKTSYRYFLKGTSDFTGHVSEAQYLTKEFTSRYPIASTAYQEGTSTTPEAETTALSSSMVELSAVSYTYDGTAKKPAVTVKNGSKTLKADTDYTVSYKNNTNAGTATVTVTGKGDYTGTVTKEFTIAKAEQKVTASVAPGSIAVGETATITAKAEGGLTYQSGDERVTTVDQNGVVTGKSTGTAEITVNAAATDNYKSGSTTVKVTVNKQQTTSVALSSCTVELSAASYTYDGTAKKPAVTVKNDSKTLKADTDYTVSYKNNTNAGTATVTVTGKGDYTGTVEKAFTISQATQKITATSSYKKTVANAAFKLNAKTSGDGKLSYKSDNKKVATVSSAGKVTLKGVGKATITITAKGTNNYKQATKKVTITVNPKGTTLSKLMNVKGKKLKATWKKVSGISGYEIQYGASKTFKGAKTAKATASKTSATISGLKKGKTYYVRIRTYKTMNGKKYSSTWSASMKLKITK